MSMLRLGKAGEALLEEAHHRIESFDMTDLEDEGLGLGEGRQFERLLGIVGDGFFDQDVFAGLKEEPAGFVMVNGGGGDGDRVGP